MDILWPRWVARIGVTRSTQACFLTADRQCTELPLLRRCDHCAALVWRRALQVASIDAPTDDNLFAEPVLTEPLSLNGGDAPLQVASVVPLPPGAGGGDN